MSYTIFVYDKEGQLVVSHFCVGALEYLEKLEEVKKKHRGKIIRTKEYPRGRKQ